MSFKLNSVVNKDRHKLNQLQELKKETEYSIQFIQDKIEEIDQWSDSIYYGEEVMERAALINYLNCLYIKLDAIKEAMSPLATEKEVLRVSNSWR